MYFCNFIIISPQKRMCPFNWITWILFTLQCKVWLQMASKTDFWSLSTYFSHFAVISPCKRAWPFIWTDFTFLLTPKDALGIGLIYGSGEENQNVKSLQQEQTRQISISLEPLAQVSLKVFLMTIFKDKPELNDTRVDIN